ncbi:LysR family transcriptional regulator [Ramlibacter sp.]|uniref:LysR family transcriptional regulator n=1 Tax=Ramlibacter sp. TaxID=1917967 RepID=UPI0017B45A0F|nr:LysR family transcriptional regulator [Ramlibacter sp.]MBA2675970.1 LysR family transcriptional regulator [Ramlibacter sp.]
MQVFVRVAELGGFAPAARELDLSPAMVAKHVLAIEARLGARLLHRTTRRQSLTDVGRLYLERSRAALAEFQAAEASAAELQAQPRGLLRVTAPVILGSRGLAPLLPAFTAKHPQVQVELVLHDRVVDLMDEGFDAALRSGPLPDLPLSMLLCATPAYLRRHGRPRVPADLSNHACLGFSHWVHQDRWRLFAADGREHTVPIRSRLTSNNGEALRQAALAGGGILMQWEPLLREDLAAGRLVRVLSRYAPPQRPAHLLYLREQRPTAKLRHFVDHVLKHLGA